MPYMADLKRWKACINAELIVMGNKMLVKLVRMKVH